MARLACEVVLGLRGSIMARLRLRCLPDFRLWPGGDLWYGLPSSNSADVRTQTAVRNYEALIFQPLPHTSQGLATIQRGADLRPEREYHASLCFRPAVSPGLQARADPMQPFVYTVNVVAEVLRQSIPPLQLHGHAVNRKRTRVRQKSAIFS